MRGDDTIVALSSGQLPSGVAVVRISGERTAELLSLIVDGPLPAPRILYHRDVRLNGDVLDKGLVVYFPGPSSFTGEDCCELQLHGSVAVVRAVLRGLQEFEGVRLAEAGEFTRRAFENGKLDMTEVEGLGDLIQADTESQRIMAVARMRGGLSDKVQNWRSKLLHLRAEIEAQLDFSDEDDVAETMSDTWLATLGELENSLQKSIADVDRGRIVRDGFRVALAGAPNAGKSSLLNALAKSDLAIVSDEAGTTRDVREVPLDVDGQLIIFVDMAGLRDAESAVEQEGVRRAGIEISQADLVLCLQSPEDVKGEMELKTEAAVWHIDTKSDLASFVLRGDYAISTRSEGQLTELLDAISARAVTATNSGDGLLVSHERDRVALQLALSELAAVCLQLDNPEVAAEGLRQSSDALGRLIGSVDAEQVLDRLFSSFCIGK